MFERNFTENSSDAPIEVREAGPGRVPNSGVQAVRTAAPVLEPGSTKN